MADETIELTEVQEVLDGLSSPTDEEFVQAVRAYSDGAVASAAAKLAMAGGGGGGPGPDFTTPVTISPSDSGATGLVVEGIDDGNATYIEAGVSAGFMVSAWDVGENFIRIGVSSDHLSFFGHTPTTRPEIPATPNAQDIADVLVALGLATQAA